MTTRRERRLAALERLHPPPPPPRPEIAWLSAMTVPELCVLERLPTTAPPAPANPRSTLVATVPLSNRQLVSYRVM